MKEGSITHSVTDSVEGDGVSTPNFFTLSHISSLLTCFLFIFTGVPVGSSGLALTAVSSASSELTIFLAESVALKVARFFTFTNSVILDWPLLILLFLFLVELSVVRVNLALFLTDAVDINFFF